MRITEDVRRYAAEQGLTEETAMDAVSKISEGIRYRWRRCLSESVMRIVDSTTQSPRSSRETTKILLLLPIGAGAPIRSIAPHQLEKIVSMIAPKAE